MILELNIKNFAIIEDLKVSFTEGLNVITGETGSGKSILIEAIGILLGDRSSKDLVQTGYDRAYIEAGFYIKNIDGLRPILDEYSIDMGQDQVLIISKEISSSGPSLSKVNGKLINLTMLKNITSKMVDIFGQHDHQSLLDVAKHEVIIDSFGDQAYQNLRREIKDLYGDLLRERRKLKDLNIGDEERDREIDILNYQINEINDAGLTANDSQGLENEFKRLSNVNHISRSLEEALGYLSDDYNNVSLISNINKVSTLIKNSASYDPGLKDLYERANGVNFELQDINRDLADYLDSMNMDEERLDYLVARLDLINSLKNKYGKTIDLVLDFRDKADIRLEKLLNINKELEICQNNISLIEEKLDRLSGLLSEGRRDIGLRLEKDLKKELKALNMDRVNFKVKIESLDDFSSNGKDKIEFLISTNLGEDLKPLSKIVSGGEMSRIMLAFKGILAYKDNIETLIFDEIDAGISGRTAQIVGEKIYNISKNHQVLCISHLPQIAAMGDSHFLINKMIMEQKTKTIVNKLTEEERVVELARILGGVDLTETTLLHAKEMLEMSRSIK